MSPNNGILLNDILRPKLLSILFASCPFINLYVLLPHAAHFDNNIDLRFLVFITFEFTFSISFLQFKQYVDMFYNYSFFIVFLF